MCVRKKEREVGGGVKRGTHTQGGRRGGGGDRETEKERKTHTQSKREAEEKQTDPRAREREREREKPRNCDRESRCVCGTGREID